MRKFMRYGITGFVLYASINWIADNPAKINVLRKQMNAAVDAGIETGSESINEVKKQ